MSSIHFANPEWAHLIWAVVAMIALHGWLESRGLASLDRFLAPPMQRRLASTLPRGRRWLRLALFGLAGSLLVVALMRPQGAATHHPMPRVGAQIMVCLDVSKSMLAEDTAPNRLGRAKAELSDLLSYLDGDQVGLIAFAGKATVLCPLTPDYGFFRLILDAAGPHNAGRGGTRLEEPIRKALAGFRNEADVSRAILLVTDGEDHDSFPEKAAEEAAQRGIRMIAIGFGDEAGSQITVTDPRSGARTVMKDASGKPVVTRLDGEKLRRLVEATQGVYVPAGTGALDLESIYDAHIKPLTRGRLSDRGQVVRSERFQWAVLAGLVALIAAVAAGSGGTSTFRSQSVPRNAKAGKVAAGIAAVLLMASSQTQAWAAGAEPPASGTSQAAADEKPRSPDAAEGPEKTSQAKDSVGKKATPPKSAKPGDPRSIYNEALAYLPSNPDEAERRLTQARRDSGTDGEVRFCATYNLGWVEVARADQLLKDNAEQALVHLRAAADWFHDAVRLRPEARDARHNLEIVLRRILELTDSLHQQGDPDLARRLDELIESQRGLVAQVAEVVQDSSATSDPSGTEARRLEFRKLSTEQRKILADSQALAKSTRADLDSLSGKKDDEKSPQDRMRAAQLENVLTHLDQANQRMGQARSQMRSQQVERAFRRGAAALSDIKRARDQLREPVEVLTVILTDAAELAGHTRVLAAQREAAAKPGSSSPPPLNWLTREYLEETQASVAQRAAELTARLEAGLEEQKKKPAGPPTTEQQRAHDAEDEFLGMLREAVPFLKQADQALEKAREQIGADDLPRAVEHQAQAIQAMLQARERFLDVRGLIELTYADETRVQALLSPEKEQATAWAELAAAARRLQTANQERSARLDKKVDAELLRVSTAAASPPAKPTSSPGMEKPAGGDHQQERKRLEAAKQLLEQARDAMASCADALNKSDASPPAAPPPEIASKPAGAAEPTAPPSAFAEARGHAQRAVSHLEELRRLFFSIVEHLRETAQRQVQLNDETQTLAGLTEAAERKTKLGPLAERQDHLQGISAEIAKVLEEQSQQSLPAAPDAKPADAAQKQAEQQAREQLAKAAKLVTAGSEAMQQAGQAMRAEAAEIKPIRERQDVAAKNLLEALALLEPPQPQEQPPKPENGEEKKQDPSQKAEDASAARLLQAVRDREAQRRKSKPQGTGGTEPVDKDW